MLNTTSAGLSRNGVGAQYLSPATEFTTLALLAHCPATIQTRYLAMLAIFKDMGLNSSRLEVEIARHGGDILENKKTVNEIVNDNNLPRLFVIDQNGIDSIKNILNTKNN